MAEAEKEGPITPDAVLDSSGKGGGLVGKAQGDAALVAFLTAAKSAAPVDPEQAQLDIIRRILSAGSEEEVLQQTAAIHARDVLGQELTILGFDYNESDIAGSGPDFYMLINCTNDDGEAFKVTCGAINVMAQLYRLGQLNAFPLVAKIVEAEKATASGYKPMWLESVPKPF